MNETSEQLTYAVLGMRCGHCQTAITAEVERVAGVDAVEVDLEAERATVTGSSLDDEAIRAAINDAGYDIA